MAIKHWFKDFQEVVENGVIHTTTVQQRLVLATVKDAKESGMRLLSDCNSVCLLVSPFPFFKGQLWSGQNPICVGTNVVTDKGCEGQHDRLINQLSDEFI